MSRNEKVSIKEIQNQNEEIVINDDNNESNNKENGDLKNQSMRDKVVASVLLSSIAGCLLLWASFGVRQSIGVFLIPITTTTGWNRATFSIAAATIQLTWGIFQPFIVFLGEKKYGFGKVIFFSTLLYAISSYIMYASTVSSGIFIFANFIQGIGCAGNSFPIVLASVSKRIAPNNRYKSIIFGVVSSFGSFGQCCFLPMARQMISTIGWTWTFIVYGAMMTVVSFTAFFLQTVPQKQNEDIPANDEKKNNADLEKKEPMNDTDDAEKDLKKSTTNINKSILHPDDMTAKETLKYALTSPTFLFITLGFSTCGFHIAFMATHLPSYLQDHGVDPSLAAWTISVIGLGSMFGTIGTGILCTKFKPKYVLACLYASRAVLMCIFYWVPLTLTTVFVFSVLIGFLWLSTVPPTTRFIGDVFGYKYLGTLTSITFIGHQIGSFLGAYLSGIVYDQMGTYDRIWMVSIALGFFSSIANLLASDAIPIRHRK
ncbi:unnamed protein product [Cunninghamella blakesleeana]